ncbi:MAG: hypothetical protein E6K72_11460 [Candidatus Eisenbacteria bacterium]|uniref:FAD-binding PCMH-type domain-containing protein n=1 Tax=Eiseniibacteriota bacterium TaxID=2212470 RepID=A0A538SG96_UNCEI|nr:MAG: hypothetical protein E6K72_11460 [Candidatus Eisenbacteria bacterium]
MCTRRRPVRRRPLSARPAARGRAEADVLTLPSFEWARPRTVEETLAALSDRPGETLVVAGGTDAVPNLKHRLHEPRLVVHIGGVRELQFVRDAEDGLHLGALVTLAELARHPVVRRDFPSLARAAGLVAGPQLRNMGTLGGNLCLDTRCTYYNQTYFWRSALGYCLKKDGAAAWRRTPRTSRRC